MPHLRFEGPSGARKAVAHVFGRVLERGESAMFTEQEARSLAAQPHLGMVEVSAPAPISKDRPSAHGSRRQWAAYAAEKGVEVADGMTRDQIVAAIDGEQEAPDGAEPEADTGEGHPSTSDDPKEQ